MKHKIKILIIFLIMFSPLFSIAEIYPDYPDYPDYPKFDPAVKLSELERELDELLSKSEGEIIYLKIISIPLIHSKMLCKKENNIKHCEAYIDSHGQARGPYCYSS